MAIVRVVLCNTGQDTFITIPINSWWVTSTGTLFWLESDLERNKNPFYVTIQKYIAVEIIF